MSRAGFTVLLVLLLAAFASALEPEEIMVIASGADTESVEIAKYYCQKRAVPLENLIKLPLPAARADSISRKDYDFFIAAPIRQLLSTKDYAGKIKCLLNVYGIPFKTEY